MSTKAMTTTLVLTASAASLSVAAAAAAAAALLVLWRNKQRKDSSSPKTAYQTLIGNTPLIRLHHLSALMERNIHVKMESLNPGGTGKDRAALGMILFAENITQELPKPEDDSTAQPNNDWSTLSDSIQQAMKRSKTGGLVVEGTSGSTGISLATLCAARGHGCLVVLPDDQASEKQQILTTLGAIVHIVPTAAISNPNHYVNYAKRLAKEAKDAGIAASFIHQFENLANYQVHYQETGPEILLKCPQISAFCMSAGTGGTIAGVGNYLKSILGPRIQIVLVDPPGSALYHKVQHGILYAPQQRERCLKRHRYDTLAEGIGLDRLTQNFVKGHYDSAIQVSDQEAVDMAHWLLRKEGLWVGSSSAMNVVGAVRTAKSLKASSHVVTMICDAGQRHVTRFWNRDFVLKWGLEWPGDNDDERIPDCLQEFM